jgi:hypothetical protein
MRRGMVIMRYSRGSSEPRELSKREYYIAYAYAPMADAMNELRIGLFLPIQGQVRQGTSLALRLYLLLYLSRRDVYSKLPVARRESKLDTYAAQIVLWISAHVDVDAQRRRRCGRGTMWGNWWCAWTRSCDVAGYTVDERGAKR